MIIRTTIRLSEELYRKVKIESVESRTKIGKWIVNAIQEKLKRKKVK